MEIYANLIHLIKENDQGVDFDISLQSESREGLPIKGEPY